jgi:hypothetical protein
MKLYGGIDLHSNNSVIALLDEEDKVVYRRRLTCPPQGGSVSGFFPIPNITHVR